MERNPRADAHRNRIRGDADRGERANGPRGLSEAKARQVPANARRWWKNSAYAIHVALPNSLVDELGVPRLAA